MTTESRKPGIFIKTAHHENNNDNKNNYNNNNNKKTLKVTIIMVTTMALSFNQGYHWRKNPWTHFIHFAEHRTSRFNCHFILGGGAPYGVEVR